MEKSAKNAVFAVVATGNPTRSRSDIIFYGFSSLTGSCRAGIINARIQFMERKGRRMTTIPVQMTARGLLIPRAALQNWGEIEVLQEDRRIIIQPKTVTPPEERELVIQALREDGLLLDMTGEPLSPPVTPAERAELAQKLSVGRPLSELVGEERQAGW
jgi:hypothetical protein